MIKGRFLGNASGPRPNEIVQLMRGDYNVNISYWKAWRSREVAQEYAKGSSGASYKLLPDYLNRLVVANPGTIADLRYMRMRLVTDLNVCFLPWVLQLRDLNT